jgi:hypothetical protein
MHISTAWREGAGINVISVSMGFNVNDFFIDGSERLERIVDLASAKKCFIGYCRRQ